MQAVLESSGQPYHDDRKRRERTDFIYRTGSGVRRQPHPDESCSTGTRTARAAARRPLRIYTPRDPPASSSRSRKRLGLTLSEIRDLIDLTALATSPALHAFLALSGDAQERSC